MKTSKEMTLSHLNNPATSFWLKKALKESANRDVLDALRDAEELAFILKAKFEEMTKGVQS